MAGIKTRRRQAEARAAAEAAALAAAASSGGSTTNPLFPAGGGGSTVGLSTTGTPATGTMGPFGTAATTTAAGGLKPGQYKDTRGRTRNADGSLVVSAYTQKLRAQTFGVSNKTLVIVGVVVVGVGLLIWWKKKHQPAGIVERVKAAAAKGAAGVKSAAGL